jgi:hypothetical protein
MLLLLLLSVLAVVCLVLSLVESTTAQHALYAGSQGHPTVEQMVAQAAPHWELAGRVTWTQRLGLPRYWIAWQGFSLPRNSMCCADRVLILRCYCVCLAAAAAAHAVMFSLSLGC